MPTLAKFDQCCGCAACANKCARKAITMRPNHEGFLHPVIDSERCIQCGLCEVVCPGLSPVVRCNQIPKVFVVQHKDDVIRYQSTSGGAFTAIAEYVIEHDGVVFGAGLSSDFIVKHIYVESIEELVKFRNSKYVQSSIDCNYKDALSFLSQGRLVCFSGTPCQINGLHKYLGRTYDNLITIDVVCKSVPSPLVFQKYVEFKNKPEAPIREIVFRDKKRGFLYCTMAHYSSAYNKEQRKSQYRRGSESDEWLRIFLSGKISRRSCMSCHYQNINRPSDFTLGDIWETGNRLFDDNKGSTLLHVWTEKGEVVLESIKHRINCIKYPLEKSRGVSRKNTLFVSRDRDQLFNDVNILSPKLFFAKYTPYSIVIRLKQVGRYLLYITNLQSIVRCLKHKIIHR